MMRYPLLALLTAGSMAAGMAHAQAAATTTITFTGAVTDQTCKIGVSDNTSGSANVTVKMDPVHTDDFEGKEKGEGVGTKSFTLSITGCVEKGVLNGVEINFAGTKVNSDGYLPNVITTNGAEGIALRLNQDEQGNDAINPATWARRFELPTSEGPPIKQDFSVQYVKTQETIVPGKVEATLQVNMNYR